MTIGSNDNYFSYPGNDVTVDFDGPRSFTAGEVRVRLQNDATGDLSEFTAYTLEGVGSSKTIVHTIDPVPSGFTIIVEHVPVFGQSTNITNQGKYKPEVVEAALDKLAQQCNFLKRQVARRIGVTDSVDLDSFDLPPYLAGAIIGWHSSEQKLINYVSVDVSEVLVSEYMATFLQAVDAAAVRALLALGTMSLVNKESCPSIEMFESSIGFTPDNATGVGVDIPSSMLFNLYSVGGANHDTIVGIKDFTVYWTGDYSWYHKNGATWALGMNFIPSSTYGNALLTVHGNIKKMVAGAQYDVGLMDCQLTTKNEAYTFASTDRGRGVKKTNNTAYAWLVQPTATVDMPEGAMIPVANLGTSGVVTINPGAAVELQLAGGVTTGDIELAPGAVGWLWLVDKAADRWMAGGVGVTVV